MVEYKSVMPDFLSAEEEREAIINKEYTLGELKRLSIEDLVDLLIHKNYIGVDVYNTSKDKLIAFIINKGLYGGELPYIYDEKNNMTYNPKFISALADEYKVKIERNMETTIKNIIGSFNSQDFRTNITMAFRNINLEEKNRIYDLKLSKSITVREFISKLRKVDFFHIPSDISTLDLWNSILLRERPADFLREVLHALGYPIYGLTDFQLYELFTLHVQNYIVRITNYPIINLLSTDTLIGFIKQYINISHKNIIPNDRVSAIFLILTTVIPDFFDYNKYKTRFDELNKYDLKTIILLDRYVYNKYKHTNGEKFIHRIIFNMATLPASPLEPFISNYNGDYTDFADKVGMFIPILSEEKVIPAEEKYFFENIIHYEPVWKRTTVYKPPDLNKRLYPELFVALELFKLLAQYTDKELFKYYDINFEEIGNFKSRPELLWKIISLANIEPTWHWKSKVCRNSKGFNVFTGEPRILENKEDPIISYGTSISYKCYNLGELVASFDHERSDEELPFHFGIPDAVKGQDTEFTIADSKKLKLLLEEQTIYPQETIEPLLIQINKGLKYFSSTSTYTSILMKEYKEMDMKSQQVVKDYISWLFITGMYMRYWKGPGRPYPLFWKFKSTKEEDELTCTDKERMELVDHQLIIRRELLSNIPEELKTWINSLRRISLDFKSNNASLGAETLGDLIELIQKGKMCISDASNRFIQTAYYLGNTVLGLNNIKFNEMISSYLKVAQEPFIPEDIKWSGHADPWAPPENLA